MLEFGAKPPISYSDFLSCCREQLTKNDIKIIQRVSLGPFEDIEDSFPTLKAWKKFDFTLRNEIARHRAVKFTKDPLQHVRGEYYPDPFISGFAHWAVTQDSPIEAESYLDRARWDRIEELEKGHYFDIEYLIAYALKLLILERWDRINKEGTKEQLESLLAQ
jgi:hypothetical protein